jgi:glycosyltransferase involved in cell wall biosynthesis
MKLSVIISVYNSHEIVRRQLLHFKKMNLPVEIVIVDDNSSPPIKGATIRTNNKLAWTQGLGRNLGAKIAHGEYLFMTDIDHIISREALEDALNFTGNKMIFRRQIAILDKNGNIKQDKQTLKKWGWEKDNLDASVHGNTFVIKKSVFEELGGYDPKTCTSGLHPIAREGDDCYFNAKWNRKFKGERLAVGRDIYMFPIGRFNKNRDLNPFGLFHNLSQDGKKKCIKEKKMAEKKLTKGILFYTNNKLNMKLALNVRKNIALSGLPITCISNKPTKFGTNIVFDESGMCAGEAIARKILTGLKTMKEDIVYLCEADVFYHPTHFEFTPKDLNTFYYNGSYWMLRLPDGFAVHYNVSPLSGLVVGRKAALKHFKERVALIKKEGFSLQMGYEPMTHHRIKWKFFCPFEIFIPQFPNVDVAHGGNVTNKRWSPDLFRRKPKFWEESDINHVPGWPDLPALVGPLYQPKI